MALQERRRDFTAEGAEGAERDRKGSQIVNNKTERDLRNIGKADLCLCFLRSLTFRFFSRSSLCALRALCGEISSSFLLQFVPRCNTASDLLVSGQWSIDWPAQASPLRC